MSIRFWAAAVIVLSLAPAAIGQLLYSTQTRKVSAFAPNSGGNDTSTASTFGTFNRTVSATGPFGGTSQAKQNSTLGATAITATGMAKAGVSSFNNFGTAGSELSVSFVAQNNSTFTLTGTLNYVGGSLTGPGVNVNLSTGAGGSVNYAGTLVAGATYTLVLNTYGSTIIFTPLQGDFDVALTLTGVVVPPQTTAFTYQGVVNDSAGQPIDGAADMEFRLYPTAVGTIGGSATLTASNVTLTQGLFTRSLDFGNAFDGKERWLEIGVRSPAGSGNFTTLAPRIKLQTSPYAAYALKAGAAATATTADSAAAVPWTGVSGVPSYILNTYSPWSAISNGINYTGGNVAINSATAENKLSVNGTVQILTPATGAHYLAFGVTGNMGGTAEGNDPMAFYRFNYATDESELRLIIGDNTASNLDFFTIGALTNAGFIPAFMFRSDGLATKPGGGSWAALSDPRVKHDIAPLQGTLDRLLTLRGYHYLYNDDVISSGRALPGTQIGLMADEVERVFPDWVTRDAGGMRMVSERSTTALMVEALRDLRTEKDSQIAALKEQNAALEARLRTLEERFNTK